MYLAVPVFRCNGCEAVLQGIETQITKANINRETQIRTVNQMEQEVSVLIKNY